MTTHVAGDDRIDPDTGELQFFNGQCWDDIYIIPRPDPLIILGHVDEANPSNYIVGAVRVDPITGKLQIFSGKRWITLPHTPNTPQQNPEEHSHTSTEDPFEAYERAKKAVSDM